MTENFFWLLEDAGGSYFKHPSGEDVLTSTRDWMKAFKFRETDAKLWAETLNRMGESFPSIGSWKAIEHGLLEPTRPSLPAPAVDLAHSPSLAGLAPAGRPERLTDAEIDEAAQRDVQGKHVSKPTMARICRQAKEANELRQALDTAHKVFGAESDARAKEVAELSALNLSLEAKAEKPLYFGPGPGRTAHVFHHGNGKDPIPCERCGEAGKRSHACIRGIAHTTSPVPIHPKRLEYELTLKAKAPAVETVNDKLIEQP